MHDLQIDGPRQTDGLLQPALIRPRGGRGGDFSILPSGLLQDRDDDDGANVIAELFQLRDDRRRFGITFVGNCLLSRQEADSSLSNICIGWPGMMVEMACL
ncbi:hypothetical protein P6U16_01970 [Rhizobium sp. 32-5/1]|uniref:hypothetical protein n=1 Tax=Rhizobium sp. 32-5/1 TaxID=3019602 RepID=UPI00240DF5B4|nr:hypothetical protein [Rhizobium sp. 32-5/1]WEZ85266.1 hypothetical protein P6U16_01970 [Rhizobium sp. 32-5/1]